MSIELKIKAKSLAAEAKIIRQEELKLLKKAKTSLHFKKCYEQQANIRTHRVVDVRLESRATELARAFIRGKPRSFTEPNSKLLHPIMADILIDKVSYMVGRYNKGVRYGTGYSNTRRNKITNKVEAIPELRELVKNWFNS